jgi:hypothetical protein
MRTLLGSPLGRAATALVFVGAGSAAAAATFGSPGRASAWGYNDDGQCVPPSINLGFKSIGAGRLHSLAIR